jgi:aspartyl protease
MRLALLLVVLALGACVGLGPAPGVRFAVVPPVSGTYLRYRVDSPRGPWTREFVIGDREFVERRASGAQSYELGLHEAMAWMRVGGRPPVEIDGPLAADERREAAWIGLLVDQPGGRQEVESCSAERCTVVYTPPDGHALWVEVDRTTNVPVSFSWIARDHAVESCDGIRWTEGEGPPAMASVTCSGIVDTVGRETTSWTLEERRVDADPPEWARVAPDEVLPLRPLRRVAEFPVADPSLRVYVPVEAGAAPAMNLVLDTGSPITVLTHRVANTLGVVPSPDDLPEHVRPPYLAEGTYDPAIVDRLVMGPVELHGVHVLVTREDDPFASDEAGLLGMDLLARFVVDVDGPASTLRFWPHDAFRSDAFADLALAGASHGRVTVAGAVEELGPMALILDTGAPLNVVVGGPAMHTTHPHTRHDQDAMLREDDEGADYIAEIEGLSIGPFDLPKMPAIGRDRSPKLPFLEDDSALVGLGVLRHFRLAVDSRAGVVHLAPGASYAVLNRWGVEIEQRNGAPTVARAIDAERAWHPAFREGDVVRAVDGRAVESRDEALRALAAAGDKVRVLVERRGHKMLRTLRCASLSLP